MRTIAGGILNSVERESMAACNSKTEGCVNNYSCKKYNEECSKTDRHPECDKIKELKVCFNEGSLDDNTECCFQNQ